jgi:WD40 repeat protein
VAESGLGTPDSPGLADGQSPYQGLGFYTEEDAKWFFGRTTERKIILAHLRTARLTLLYAESGVGKSSLLRAGVAARLRELATHGTTAGHSFVPVVFSSWKDDPVDDLISEIERQLGSMLPENGRNGNQGARPQVKPIPALPRGNLADAITTASEALHATLAIILDQFEEHFSYRLSASEPGRLADELAACINSPHVPANFLIAVREDAYGTLGDLFSGRISNVYSNYLHLEYLTRDAAREAIEKPVEVYNAEHGGEETVSLDDDLADAVLDEVRRGQLELSVERRDRDGSRFDANADEIETPFLQLVMSRLWEQERSHGSHLLRTSTLDVELGGAETIVRSHVGQALSGLTGEEPAAATDMFHDLVTPSGVKVAHTADDLAKMTGHSREVVASVLDKLYRERIVRAVDPAPGTTQNRYEIFHDRLATPILDWRGLQENARLARAQHQAEREADRQRAQAKRFRQRARIMLGLAVTLLVLLAAVVALWQYARDQSGTASRAKHAALTDAAKASFFGLTTRAESRLTTRPDVSLLLYLAAYKESPQPVAARSLVATLAALKRYGAVSVLHGHTDAVDSVAFNPAGTTLASASGDKTIRLWRVSRLGASSLGAPLRADGPLYSAAFSPTGRTLASGSFDDVILWSVARHAEQAVIPYDRGAVRSVAFDPRGRLLAAGGSDGTVLLWNQITRHRTILHIAPGKPARSVAFSPNGAILATSSENAIILWNTATGRQIGPPLVDRGVVYSLAFSPSGGMLAVGGSDSRVVLWNVASRSQVAPELRAAQPAYSVAFSPDGRTLAAGTVTTTVLWNVSTHRRQGPPLFGHRGPVLGVAFSPTRHVLASAGADRTVILWRHPTRVALGAPVIREKGGIYAMAISPDGALIASGGHGKQILLTNRRTGRLERTLSPDAGGVTDVAFDPVGHVLAASFTDGTIRLWDVDTGQALGAPFRGHVGPAYAIAFNRSGTKLVSGGADGTVRIWNVQTHTEFGKPLVGDFGDVYAVAFSPNGNDVASGGDGRAIRLWNARTVGPLHPPLIAQNSAVFALAYSPNGRLLASGGGDDSVHLWRVERHAYLPVKTLTGAQNLVRSVAFSPNGQTLAYGSTDNLLRLADVATGEQLGPNLIGHRDSVEKVAFSPDGRFVYSGSNDGTAREWPAVNLPRSFADLRDEVCTFVGGGLSRTEWSLFASDVPYQRICPQTTPG